jgi:dynein heavy chain, axonemal
MLDKMEKEWVSLDFSIIEWKNRGIKILQGSRIEEIQLLLDEHTVKAQTIRVDPYNK